MSTPADPRREHSSTYFVRDHSNQDELARLQIQDQMLTSGMGGVLPEQPDPTIFRHALDVSCGTGGWLIEAAKTYPIITELVGVDVSSVDVLSDSLVTNSIHVDNRSQGTRRDVD